MIERLTITAATFVAAGMIPPILAVYLFRTHFIGGPWAAVAIGLISSFLGGLLDVLLLGDAPDIIPVGNVVDAGPPLITAAVLTVLFAAVSRSNTR